MDEKELHGLRAVFLDTQEPFKDLQSFKLFSLKNPVLMDFT